MSITVSALAEALDARLEGDGTLPINGAAEPASAGPEDIALAMAPAYAEGLGKGRARAAILWEGADWQELGLSAALYVQRPRYAMAGVTAMLDPGPEIAPGTHPLAHVDPTAVIGEGAAIGPFAVIGRDVRIGSGARIAAHCSIAEETEIGDDVLLHPGVRIGARIRIGARFIAQPGAVIGADGLSFVTPEKSGVEKARESLGDQGAITAQSWTRIHSLGGVEIGDDVELGANACIDRGTIRATRVGSGCKIDNLCHVAHNVVLGRDCLLAALTGIAGSTTVGDRCIFGGQSGVVDNIFIGDDVISTGGTKILSNVPAGRVMMGFPAVKMEQHVDMYKALRRLPRLLGQLKQGQKAVSKSGETG
ncbi:UDP-3-O-(3-hydroxymyristoyl)glucosamine N-acyltransferase [Profundibacterium mesophilum]|uniref:UDP-3-O-acylglucosamine N-acyltransferase n=1 Tax=Profundibacterium mesophilum KAUST100406-0324 TaxID=1037889 RepID=A0A921NSP9_9RHOB|nr:UDP-3-O-(3-hydroxymyristoyl)glucosamine N-acyltransferase [Profundibacterium mesophilum]KAF0674733.1 UDP-3-O-3-hydroxymyristoyl glucosamine N-acyltransferase [Profundibacterium mesophilum KAUST100406-0324]